MHADSFSKCKYRPRHPLETESHSFGTRTCDNLRTIEHNTLKIRMKPQQGMNHCAPAPPISATVLTPLVLISLAVSFATVDVKLVIDSVKAAASAAFVAKYSNSPAPSAGTV